MTDHRAIVIIGAGFAGLGAALDLEQAYGGALDTPIYVFDPSPVHFYSPSQSGLLFAPRARFTAVPYEEIMAHRRLNFIPEAVLGVDLERKHVLTARHSYPYGDLVLAVGEVVGCPQACQDIGIAGDLSHEIGKMMSDIIDRAVNHRPEYRVVIVGGGQRGVQLAAGLRALLLNIKSPARGKVSLTLIEKSTILNGYADGTRERVMPFLGRWNIAVAENTLAAWRGREVMANGRPIPAETVIWAGERTVSPLMSRIRGLRRNHRGQGLVDGACQALDWPRVWVGGSASAADGGGEAAAVAQGQHIARAIIAVRSGRAALGYCSLAPQRVIQIGPLMGLVEHRPILDGAPAIWYKRTKELAYLTSLLGPVSGLEYWLAGDRVADSPAVALFETEAPRPPRRDRPTQDVTSRMSRGF